MKKKETKEKSYDLFELLKAISVKDKTYVDNLDEKALSEISPYLILRWLSSSSYYLQVYFLNKEVNSRVFSLGKHKMLLLYLMMCCANGKQQRYKWINFNQSTKRKRSQVVQVLANALEESFSVCEDIEKLYSNDEILQLAIESGWQEKETRFKDLKKELKKRDV
jgi:hypothetical protein